MGKTKQLPAFLMLLAAAITALVTYFNGYTLKNMSIALLASMVIFYVIGCAFKMLIDSFERKNAEAKAAEEAAAAEAAAAAAESGEVVEKEQQSGQEEEKGN